MITPVAVAVSVTGPCWLGNYSFTLLEFVREYEPSLLLVGCLQSQRRASISQGRIYLDSCTYCHTETEVVDRTLYLIQPQYIPTQGQSVPALTLKRQMPGRVSTGISLFKSLALLHPEKMPHGERGIRTQVFGCRGGRLTARPQRRSYKRDQVRERMHSIALQRESRHSLL